MNDQTESESNLPEENEENEGGKPPIPTAQNNVKTQPPAPIHEPNIQFVGRREQLNKETGKMEIVPAIATRRISDGETIIKLPSDEQQKEGFYSKHAARLFALYPDDYKKPVKKGEKH